jgi:hypothetical protein
VRWLAGSDEREELPVSARFCNGLCPRGNLERPRSGPRHVAWVWDPKGWRVKVKREGRREKGEE